MKPKQQFIYFLAGDSKQQIFESPLLQKLREREIEVLLLDEQTVSRHVEEYRDRKKLTTESGGSESRVKRRHAEEARARPVPSSPPGRLLNVDETRTEFVECLLQPA